VIPPKSTVQLLVQFQTEAVGTFSQNLAFDVVCGERNNHVMLSGVCDYPKISTDSR
jgi:hypothetical protein